MAVRGGLETIKKTLIVGAIVAMVVVYTASPMIILTATVATGVDFAMFGTNTLYPTPNTAVFITYC